MNLGNDKWQNTQGKLGSSSTGRGEAPETRGRELESLLATTEYESPTDTVVVRAVLGSQLSRTAVYGPVRTVVWQGSAGDRRPYADPKNWVSATNAFHGLQPWLRFCAAPRLKTEAFLRRACECLARCLCQHRDFARFQRQREHLIDGLHGVKAHLLAHIGRQIIQVRFVALREDDIRQPSRLGCHDFLFEAADRQDSPLQCHLTCHTDSALHRSAAE